MSRRHNLKLIDVLVYSEQVILNKTLKLKHYVHRYIDVLVSCFFHLMHLSKILEVVFDNLNLGLYLSRRKWK